MTSTHPLAAIRAIYSMGLDAFCEAYKIKQVHDGGLISLKYDQIESPMHEECVADCRGLVVKADDPTHVVAMAYRKFWNLGEKYASPIDWSSARVMEKLDGSLITMYWHDGGWRVASSGHPTAGGPYGDTAETFRSMFWQTWSALGYTMPQERGSWYAFEFCRPDNRIVVRYPEPRIVLHGVRLDDFREVGPAGVEAVALANGWESVKSWPATDAASAVADAAKTDPLALEGFVVVDRHCNRVKIKNPRYVEIHHLRGNRSPRGVVELWKAGEVSEVLAHFPEMQADFDAVLGPLNTAIERVGHAWQRHAPLTDRKEFAMQVKALPFSSALFKMHTAGGGDPDALIRDMNTSAILRALGLKDEERAA